MATQQGKTQFCEVPIKLPIFPTLPGSFTRSKSPRSFASTAVVGLGIVAAMGSGNSAEAAGGTLVSATTPARTIPIPIAPAATREEIAMELSESYTCVISHVGKGSVRKRVYYYKDDGGVNYVSMDVDTDTDMDTTSGCRSGLFYQSSPATPLESSGFDLFLKYCCRCRKSLEGIDIFMYRGEKAFCSTECRYQQIAADEYREKLTSKSRKPFECSVSPCSAPLLVAAGVAAA